MSARDSLVVQGFNKGLAPDSDSGSAGASSTTRLLRGGRGGGTIHLATCKRATGRIVVPWVWAEGRDDSEWIVKGWLHPCRSCLPELAKQQDVLRARATS